MEIQCIWEHNGGDTILYADRFAGAFTRGISLEEAMGKMPREIRCYCRWLGIEAPEPLIPVVVQEKTSDLQIRDADSDVLFGSEAVPLTMDTYVRLKELALRSARDFQALYDAVADKEASALPERRTFYGPVPRTAEEMYRHTKNVNAYYFGEIDVAVDCEGTILECRERGFAALEQQPDFLNRPVCEGSYGEMWSVGKMLRRFIWHDRIHAKAMWRMAEKTFGAGSVPDVFCFSGA
ncbi:MAG: hypothetical protein IKZ31_02380 [Lentisphaeria bacterium]|nr:hypothetical protein [Lentisphaeria bacterium]